MGVPFCRWQCGCALLGPLMLSWVPAWGVLGESMYPLPYRLVGGGFYWWVRACRAWLHPWSCRN